VNLVDLVLVPAEPARDRDSITDVTDVPHLRYRQQAAMEGGIQVAKGVVEGEQADAAQRQGDHETHTYGSEYLASYRKAHRAFIPRKRVMGYRPITLFV
jgi:hypothetical protein